MFMKAIIAALALVCSTTASAYCTESNDGMGNISIICSDGRFGHLYQDKSGNVSGIVDGQPYNTYTDRTGTTRGVVNDSAVNIHRHRHGAEFGIANDRPVHNYNYDRPRCGARFC
jgi:hypothetical protein